MKLLRTVGLALLLSLLLGLVIGTAIRLRLEKPTVYIGAMQALPSAGLAQSERCPSAAQYGKV